MLQKIETSVKKLTQIITKDEAVQVQMLQVNASRLKQESQSSAQLPALRQCPSVTSMLSNLSNSSFGQQNLRPRSYGVIKNSSLTQLCLS